ncbi:hypothetical protein H4R19_004356, partial [Coemansia spiralis]
MEIEVASPEKIAAIAIGAVAPPNAPPASAPLPNGHAVGAAPHTNSNGNTTKADDDDSGEPATKRLRTDAAASSPNQPPVKSTSATQPPPATAPAAPPPALNIMTKEQHKYCTAMVRALKKHRDAGPFLQPVDIVALNIPDYPTIVKTPMDLSTVDKKLKARQYPDPQSFASDLQLMLNNCYKYNGRESVVGIMAGNLETMFETQIKKMPAGIDTVLADRARRESEGGGSRTPTSANRPKRDAHPPPSRDMPGMHRKKSRTTDPQMKFCLNIVKDFMKKANFNIAYPFLEPVDPVAMNCPDYPTIVKEPMDLSTVKAKLEGDMYTGPLEFESDMRLMLRNCYAYNPPGHPVHEAGQALEARFDSRWAEIPVPRASQSPASFAAGGAAIPHSPPVGGEDEFDKHVYGADDEIDVDVRSQGSHADEIRDLEMKVQTMARQLEELRRGETPARRHSSVRRPSVGSARSATCSPPPLSAPHTVMYGHSGAPGLSPPYAMSPAPAHPPPTRGRG